MIGRLRHAFLALPCLCLLACNSTSEIDSTIKAIELPANWQSDSQNENHDLSIKNNWLGGIKTPQIQKLVMQALAANHQLKMQAYALKISRQQLLIAGTELWPSLDLSLRSTRNKNNQLDSYTNTNAIDLNLRYELDIWGKLSANEQKNNLNYLSQKAIYEQHKQQLVVNVVNTWFTVIEAEKLLRLYKSRVKNSQQNLAIIEAGYNSGLNAALDVYLTRNELSNELTRVADQEVVKIKLVRKLERLVGEYPKGALTVNAQLPFLTDDIPLGLPSELISRKPELKASWYKLLASDANLAYTHKQRFPSLSLSASVGDSANDFNKLLSGSSLAWSLLGNITAPIFNAGRLEASENQARFELKKEEHQYLDTLYNAFSDVENAISTEKYLKIRYREILTAQENANIASTLSFEQYQSGLVNYITVLDAQNRSFEAQSSLIKIKNQLIANRINLHFSLGGDFQQSSLETKAK